MSDLWLYVPEVCDGDFCPQDCDRCYKSDAAMEAQAKDDPNAGRMSEEIMEDCSIFCQIAMR